MKNYKGRNAIVKSNIVDEVENVFLEVGDMVTIKCVEVDLGGFGYDYVNVVTEFGEEYIAIPSSELELI